MNGYNDIATEPGDDEEFAIAYGYEIITEEELVGILSPSCGRNSSSQQSLKFFANQRTASYASSSSSGVSSLMSKPMSSCSLSSQGSEMHEDGYSSGIPESHDGDDDDDMDEDQLSVERLWYVIQQKRHLHELEEEMRMAHLLTMGHESQGKKLTAWFFNLLHLPEKLKQISTDKHRFNIKTVPEEVREELKHIYVY